ncbi:MULTISPECIES: response regulator transcription factor [unclassified Coleofasciculus]|uniref:response regulator transcription factor n=1 Tax=unclassified Coleofasciculus TaxID=2692782 RepID=UPI001882381C|nr:MULTISPECIES: response regulator transcription factor [unclassified Coleofasciculus]MBE9129907.1 response regulator transcription factor [Coleofasciculus sp. LEGE 07081]MBE9151771.1 response regulator transcription factor [Coleofasciculus sp. LEGE 07092]
MRILLVEDDPYLAEALAEALAVQRYAVDTVSDGEAAWVQITTLDYDLILLDVMLPKLDGIRLCQRLRSHRYQMPILMVTARDTSTDKVIGLDAGADDYMVKPLDIPEFLARIRALLRRGSTNSPPVLQWGDLHLDPATYEVSYTDQVLRLTPKEYCLLELLLRNGRQIMSRSAIVEHLWSLENPPKEDTIKVHIKSLRQKLKIVGAPDDLIETVHGLGYRLKPLS